MVERPGVVGREPQFRLEVRQREPADRRQRQRDFPVAQHEAVQLQPPGQQRGKVQPQLHLPRREIRAAVRPGLAEADIVRDDAVDEVQPHAGKFEVHAAFVQRGDEAVF